MMTISPIKKGEFLRSLAARRLPGVSIAVAQAIVERINHTLGVAFAAYGPDPDRPDDGRRKSYAEMSGYKRRSVMRTVAELSRHGLLKKHPRRDGAPVLWVPELMDMTPSESVRRAEWIIRNKDKDHADYFGGRSLPAGGAKSGTSYPAGGAKSGTSTPQGVPNLAPREVPNLAPITL
jgi:hypothetical protein